MDVNEFVQSDAVAKDLAEALIHYRELTYFLAAVVADAAIPGFVFGAEGTMDRDTLIDTVIDWAEMEQYKEIEEDA